MASTSSPTPNRFPILSRPFLAGALASFFGLLLFCEALLRVAVPAGLCYRFLGLPADMTSLAEVRDRLEAGFSGKPGGEKLIVLGDSVLGASALMERRLPEARQKTLAAFLKEPLAQRGYQSLSLGSDGLLLADIEGLSTEFLSRPPGRILLLLNFRMFSKDFAEGPKALSRNFLLPDLPEDIQNRLAPAKAPEAEALLSDRLYAWMCDHWFLFRETQAAKSFWYYPSQKDFFQRQLEKVVPKSEADMDILEAARKQKIAPYYQAYLWEERALPLACLKRVLDQWVEHHIPVQVVLTPQNARFLGNDLDKPSFKRNREILAQFLKAYSWQGVSYQDWAGRFSPDFFLDHCHLTPEGNRKYAGDLGQLLGKAQP